MIFTENFKLFSDFHGKISRFSWKKIRLVQIWNYVKFTLKLALTREQKHKGQILKSTILILKPIFHMHQVYLARQYPSVLHHQGLFMKRLLVMQVYGNLQWKVPTLRNYLMKAISLNIFNDSFLFVFYIFIDLIQTSLSKCQTMSCLLLDYKHWWLIAGRCISTSCWHQNLILQGIIVKTFLKNISIPVGTKALTTRCFEYVCRTNISVIADTS